MPAKAVVLFSGGLDSMLAVRVLQEQGLDVEALNFRTLFTCCQDQAAEAAEALGVRLTVAATDDDYLDVIRQPQHGYGRGANPCVDCRIFMFRRARALMDELGAACVASGEVLGQRPMSQKKRDLAIIAHRAGLEDRLLRPLSAQLLPITQPERDGVVDRQRLYGFVGRSRKGLIELARRYGFRHIPQPSSGCALTMGPMAAKVFDLLAHEPDNARWDFELLKYGRHYRRDAVTKLVVGRREEENAALVWLAGRDDARQCALIEPAGFTGPAAVLLGEMSDERIDWAAAMIWRQGRSDGPAEVQVTVAGQSRRRSVAVDLAPNEELTPLG